MSKRYILYLLCVCLWAACREDERVFLSDDSQVAVPLQAPVIQGFYQLNEGNMGMNRASIDRFDYTTGVYTRDIFSAYNPEIVKELGDVGNDIGIYGDKVYAVINVSNYVEVFDRRTVRHIGTISIPNVRYVTFEGGKAYFSSYAGPVAIDPNANKGMVVEVDTASLAITRQVEVGYQPDGVAVANGKLYVANSGGYRVPNYDRTVSVIDLASFRKIKDIDVAINLHHLTVDKRGFLYVTSRGDYYGVQPDMYVIDTKMDKVVEDTHIPVTNFWLDGDSLYYYSVAFSYVTGKNTITYGIYDTLTRQKLTDHFITDGTESQIMIPYGIAVNPVTKEIFVTDAQNYVVTGYVYCFTPDGKLKWKTEGGNIPGHFAFYKQ